MDNNENLEILNDNELPPLHELNNELPNLIYTGRVIAMPSECSTNPLQRALADSIIRMVSMDELRILFACGAKVCIYINHNSLIEYNSVQFLHFR